MCIDPYYINSVSSDCAHISSMAFRIPVILNGFGNKNFTTIEINGTGYGNSIESYDLISVMLCGYLFSCMLLVFFELLWCLCRLIQEIMFVMLLLFKHVCEVGVCLV